MSDLDKALDAIRRFAAAVVDAMGGPDALLELKRRREANECVAHDDPRWPALLVYDGDPVCEDCAVAYLREDMDEWETDRG